jgi:metal-dependent amidase/aminoacylase/carboxypeptidase family protein
MPIINRIADFHAEMTQWRHRIHAHPEIAFEERKTAQLVSELLESFGILVDCGIARTGVIGTLEGSIPSSRAIALRADIDALHIEERNNCPHASRQHGRMHACGHDGHTVMLLGAAKHLAETRNFAGTIYFIFQPAEENEGGARLMIEEGVLQKYPVEAVYGMHNWPELPAGQFAIRPGPMMAAFDIFEIAVTGRGGHAAMPHLAVDPIVAAAQIVTGLQTIASRNVHPLESAVVSVTQIHGGDTWNVDSRSGGVARDHPFIQPCGARSTRGSDPPRSGGCLPRLWCGNGAEVRAPLSADDQCRTGSRDCGNCRSIARRREQRQTRSATQHGRGGFRVFSRR